MFKKILLLFMAVSQGMVINNLKLKQVIILSRHNIRTPIAPDLLVKYSPRNWTMLDQAPGQLTEKGSLLEERMGRYFKEWFQSEQFLQEKCPGNDSAYIYANSMNRTVKTAEAFVRGAFEDCNVTVHHKYTYEEMESMFKPVICNITDEIRNTVQNKIKQNLYNTKLQDAYLELNKILDIKNSEECLNESICDLTDKNKSHILFENCKEPWVLGPLYVANTVVDSFIMSFYEGLPIEDIAWGYLTTPEEWQTVTEISRQDQNIRYTTIAKYISAELFKYLSNFFLNYADVPKFIMVVGHDFNQNTLTHSMGFKPFHLPYQFELYPIGGKIVFQRWGDSQNDYLKIEYVYPSWTQARHGDALSMDDPPQRELLQLEWCEVDGNGFCPWKEFINKLSLLQ